MLRSNVLSAEEKRQARAYAGKGWEALPPAEIYAKLLGLDATAASLRAMQDLRALTMFNARMQPLVIINPALD
jgi:hypothetical protein